MHIFLCLLFGEFDKKWLTKKKSYSSHGHKGRVTTWGNWIPGCVVRSKTGLQDTINSFSITSNRSLRGIYLQCIYFERRISHMRFGKLKPCKDVTFLRERFLFRHWGQQLERQECALAVFPPLIPISYERTHPHRKARTRNTHGSPNCVKHNCVTALGYVNNFSLYFVFHWGFFHAIPNFQYRIEGVPPCTHPPYAKSIVEIKTKLCGISLINGIVQLVCIY